jgi:hypothetical protein
MASPERFIRHRAYISSSRYNIVLFSSLSALIADTERLLQEGFEFSFDGISLKMRLFPFENVPIIGSISASRTSSKSLRGKSSFRKDDVTDLPVFTAGVENLFNREVPQKFLPLYMQRVFCRNINQTTHG